MRLLERGLDDKDDKDDDGNDNGDDHDDDEEIDYYRNYEFWPQVLGTCQQLSEEGTMILYANTIGIDLCRYHYAE